jgi:hypothetical protein
MTTFTNGQYFLWHKKTSPASPYVATGYTRVIADFVPRLRFSGQWPHAGNGGLQFGVVRRSNIDALTRRGESVISGRAYRAGVPARRHITIMTQPPRSRVVAELETDDTTGTFSANVLPGTYVVIDTMTDNSRQALVYDWVAVS